jgi:hypothetical protein
MRTKYILFILTICFNFEVNCQDLYSKQDQSNNWFYDIFQEKGNSNLVLSNLNYTVEPISNKLRSKVEVLKLSSSGSIIFSKQLDSNFSYNKIECLNANYYILGKQTKYYASGNSSQLIEIIKYDLNFNVVKKVIIDSFYNEDPMVVKLIKKQNRFYLGYLVNQNPDTFNLFKLDLNLNKLDSLTYTTGSLFDIENLGNDILLCGRSFFQNGLNSTGKIAKIDTSFNLIWQFYLDSLIMFSNGCGTTYPNIDLNFTHAIELDSNKYFIRGNTFSPNSNCITKAKSLSAVLVGNKIVRQTHITGIDTSHTMCMGGFGSSSKRYNFIYSVSMAGYDSNNPFPPQQNNTGILIQKIDTSGNLLWVNYYGGDKYYLPQSIHATSDSGVVICGMRYDHEIPQVLGVCEGFVLKLSKNGLVEIVGVNENGKLNMNYHKCFPNPTKEELFFDIPFQMNVEIIITDELGREIFVCKNYQNLSALKIAELKPGTYVYKIITNIKTYSGKFVKE